MKKWCSYCKINIPYSKQAIVEHEGTRVHEQNKQRQLQHQHRQASLKEQKEQKQKKQKAITSVVPTAAKGSQLQKQITLHRENVKAEGRSAIHRLIAQKTRGVYGAPIEYPEEDYEGKDCTNLVEKDEQMWKIELIQNKAWFINRITHAKRDQPPIGYLLTQSMQEQWDYFKSLEKGEEGGIGLWEAVELDQYAADLQPLKQSSQPLHQYQQQSQNSSSQQRVKKQIQNQSQILKEEYIIKRESEKNLISRKVNQNISQKKVQLSQISQQIANNLLTTEQVIQAVVTNKLQQCKTIKEQNQALKSLISNDIQITRRQYYANMIQEDDKQQCVGFKPKKKIKTLDVLNF